MKNALKSADLSKKISEASNHSVKSIKTKHVENVTKPGETLLIVNPNPTVQVRPDAINEHQHMSYNSAGLKPNIKLYQPVQNLAANNEDAIGSSKIRDIRELLSFVTFDEKFYTICNNCATALDECDQVLHVRINFVRYNL